MWSYGLDLRTIRLTVVKMVVITVRDVAAAPQIPPIGGAQANFGGPS